MIPNALRQLGFFTEADILLFEKAIKLRTIAKNEYILREGKVCSSIFFIISGSFCQYSIKNEIEQNVIDLHLPGEWCLNHSSFTLQKPSTSSIQALSDGIVWELSIHSLHALIAHSHSFLQMGRVLEQAVSRVQFFDNSLTPLEKYQTILDQRPALLLNFPLKLIASYLKIVPETLSRVREQISKKQTT